MVFSSSVFIFIFLPFVLFLYYFARKELRNILLVIASIIFYAWGEPKLVWVMILSILMNYVFGILIYKVQSSKNKCGLVLILAVLFNIGLLILFKYSNFLITNLNLILNLFGITQFQNSPIKLPIGISFYTFQALSYVIDVYRDKTKVQKRLLDLALYITLFPQLIAGPIVRYHDIANQIGERNHSIIGVASGINRFIIGFGKKIIIANTVGSIADNVFALSANDLTFSLAWLGIIAYSLQIYYDFSGYSDMAIGLGRMFGFEFLENFNYPYISRSIKEFWRRWHISLSSWFRDYLYIPLGGNRHGSMRTIGNLIIVFALTGMWHGASWNFLIWGLFHGLFLIIERLGIIRFEKGIQKYFGHIYTLLVVMIGWVFFRADTLAYALGFIKAMSGFGKGSGLANYPMLFLNNKSISVLIIAAIGSTPLFGNAFLSVPDTKNSLRFIDILRTSYIIVIFIISLLCLSSMTYNPFIYFRF